MLIAEYDYDVDIAVQREEEREIALKEGEAKGFSLGVTQGISEGSYQAKLETARLMKQANCKLDFIMQITGLLLSEIEKL